MEALIYHMEEEKTGFLENRIKLSEALRFVIPLITAVWFIVTMRAEISSLKDAIIDLKDTDNKQYSTQDLSIKSIQNQVNTNTIQITLLQKDIEVMKRK